MELERLYHLVLIKDCVSAKEVWTNREVREVRKKNGQGPIGFRAFDWTISRLIGGLWRLRTGMRRKGLAWK